MGNLWWKGALPPWWLRGRGLENRWLLAWERPLRVGRGRPYKRDAEIAGMAMAGTHTKSAGQARVRTAPLANGWAKGVGPSGQTCGPPPKVPEAPRPPGSIQRPIPSSEVGCCRSPEACRSDTVSGVPPGCRTWLPCGTPAHLGLRRRWGEERRRTDPCRDPNLVSAPSTTASLEPTNKVGGCAFALLPPGALGARIYEQMPSPDTISVTHTLPGPGAWPGDGDALDAWSRVHPPGMGGDIYGVEHRSGPRVLSGGGHL